MVVRTRASSITMVDVHGRGIIRPYSQILDRHHRLVVHESITTIPGQRVL